MDRFVKLETLFSVVAIIEGVYAIIGLVTPPSLMWAAASIPTHYTIGILLVILPTPPTAPETPSRAPPAPSRLHHQEP
jgi:hypothetical protein